MKKDLYTIHLNDGSFIEGILESLPFLADGDDQVLGNFVIVRNLESYRLEYVSMRNVSWLAFSEEVEVQMQPGKLPKIARSSEAELVSALSELAKV